MCVCMCVCVYSHRMEEIREYRMNGCIVRKSSISETIRYLLTLLTKRSRSYVVGKCCE